MAVELAPDIRVNAIAPGMIPTKLLFDAATSRVSTSTSSLRGMSPARCHGTRAHVEVGPRDHSGVRLHAIA
jgi:NAD(P)-dependent dehydrogenase (short-subunit alcohol dehydrogenase family)